MKRVQIAKFSYILTSAAILLIGCVFLIWPESSLVALCRAVGIVILLSGLAKLFGYFANDIHQIAFQFDLALGTLTAIFGIIILIFPKRFAEYLAILVSVFVIVNALFTMQNSIEAKKFGIGKWWLLLLGGIIAFLIGMIALIKPIDTNLFIMRFAGIALMTDGLQNITVAIITIHHVRKR